MTLFFSQAYDMCNAGAVIHSHGIESCLVTMLSPLSKEFRVSFWLLVCLSSNKFYLVDNVLKWLAFLQLVLPTAFSPPLFLSLTWSCLLANLQITHMEMIKGIKGHGYYDELVVPIIENTAYEFELTESLAKAVCFVIHFILHDDLIAL